MTKVRISEQDLEIIKHERLNYRKVNFDEIVKSRCFDGFVKSP